MYENQNDRQFENSDKGQKEDESQNREGTLSQAQTQSDRTERRNFDYRSSDENQTGINVGEHPERNRMNQEEYDLSRLHGIPNNNDFSSLNMEDDDDLEEEEEEEVDLDEEDDENEVTNPGLYGDDLIGLRDS